MCGRKRSGFTLIELLVVISIVVLLMAMLLPALSRARKQARAVACQANLHQWRMVYALYTHDNTSINTDIASIWGKIARDAPDRLLCPSASKPLPGEPVGWGDAFHAYTKGRDRYSTYLYGSYGNNVCIGDKSPGRRTYGTKGAAHVPVMFDCATASVEPDHHGGPPDPECYDPQYAMSPVCINRHNGGINMLFMDWSIRKVGLKELWVLKWHAEFDRGGPWTKAGGARPEDWPEWMRKFREY